MTRSDGNQAEVAAGGSKEVPRQFLEAPTPEAQKGNQAREEVAASNSKEAPPPMQALEALALEPQKGDKGQKEVAAGGSKEAPPQLQVREAPELEAQKGDDASNTPDRLTAYLPKQILFF